MSDTSTPPPATGNGTPPAATPPATPPASADLGEAGKKALAEERKAREAAERAATAATAELEALRAKHQTAEEKAIAEAKKAGYEEATLAANRRIAAAEVKAAAGGKVRDVDDVLALLGDLDRFIRKGEVDSAAIGSAIADLVKAKPYLAANGSKPAPLPGGAGDAPAGTSFTDTIRSQINGRRN